MKHSNLIIALFASAFAVSSCSHTSKVQEGEYVIEGRIKDVPDSTVLELLKDKGNLLKPVHSAIVINGRFTFRDTISGTEPQKFYLSSDAPGFPNYLFSIWLQSGKLTQITGKDRLHPLWQVDSDVEMQRAANEFMALCSVERKRLLQLRAQEKDLIFGDTQNRNPERTWQKIEYLRQLQRPLDSLVYLGELNYMKTAPVTTVWLGKYKEYCTLLQCDKEFGHADLIRSLYTRMSEADKATETGQEITAYLNLPKEVEAGEDMTDGDLYDLDGNVHHLAEFKGKYILLDFWGQGCAPCVQAIPETEEIAEQYKGRLEVVSISVDSEEDWKAYIRKKRMEGNQWNELRKGHTGLAAAYQLKGIPHYVLISPQGKVMQIWTGYGFGTLKNKMEEMIE